MVRDGVVSLKPFSEREVIPGRVMRLHLLLPVSPLSEALWKGNCKSLDCRESTMGCLLCDPYVARACVSSSHHGVRSCRLARDCDAIGWRPIGHDVRPAVSCMSAALCRGAH